MESFMSLLYTVSFIFSIWLLIYIYLKLPRTIDVITARDNDKVLFKVYSKHNSFTVHDFTKFRKMKISFRSYVDVEAYIFRRINGWQGTTFKSLS